jgi:glutaredoxin
MYTLKECPYCDNLKQVLNEQKIPFIEKDVEINELEYEKFSKAVKSDFLPAILIGKKAFIPEVSFKTIDQAGKTIKNYLLEQSRHENHLD